MGPGREFFPKLSNCGRQSVQCSERITDHGMAIEGCDRLVQHPKSFRVIGVEFKKPSKAPLWDLLSQQIHAVQGTEQSQQVQSGSFQAHAKVDGDLQRGAMEHGSIIAPLPAQINSKTRAGNAVGQRARKKFVS